MSQTTPSTAQDSVDIQAVKTYLLELQAHLCQALADLDGKADFVTDAWTRPQGGEGRSCVIQGGGVFEKGGVNFSHVTGEALPASATAVRPELAGRRFEAMGVSLVMHPHNPYVPTSHANVRFFIASKADAEPVWWFGGGYDLTPYYPFAEDITHWHQTAQKACAPFGEARYQAYRDWCDRYFYLPHRQEARGVGGLFFDDLNDLGFAQSFALMRAVGDSYLPAYVPIVERRRAQDYGERQRKFQAYRRGRYVEFNLVYDRGTLFGLQSGGRTESILMSLPPQVEWHYNWHPEADSEEAQIYRYLKKPS